MQAPKKYQDWFRWEGFLNNSGETCPPWGVLAVTGMSMRGETVQRPVLTCAKPSTTFYRTYVVNGPTQVKAGKYGRCTRGPGPVWIQYDTAGTPANGEGWGPKPGQFTLSKNYPSTTTVVGIVDATAKILLGSLHEINIVIGKLAEAASVGETAIDVDVWKGAAGSEADSTFNLVTSDWLMKSGATDIASGKKVLAQWVNGVWYLSEAECP